MFATFLMKHEVAFAAQISKNIDETALKNCVSIKLPQSTSYRHTPLSIERALV